MTTTTQQMVLGLVADAIEGKGGYVLLHDPVHSNTGHLRTLRAGSLDHVAQVFYDFEHGYFHFRKMSREPVAAFWHGQTNAGKAEWVAGSIPDAVARVAAYLSTGGTP